MSWANIACPYNWFCGKTFIASELSDSDRDFVKQAIEKGMTFMFINCPHCNSQFQFDPTTGEAKAEYTNPNVKRETSTLKKYETISTLKNISTYYPTVYIEYIRKKRFKSKMSIFPDEEYFNIYSLEQLANNVTIDNKKVVRAKILEGYSQSLKEVGITHIIDERNTKYPMDWLSQALAVGFENTRILFFNPADNDNTLWIFHTDGGDIKNTNLTLENIITT